MMSLIWIEILQRFRSYEDYESVLSFYHSSGQYFVKFINNRLYPFSKKLPHFAPSAMRVEGGEVEIVRLDMNAGGNVLLDHTQPLHLLFGELFACAGVLVEDPFFEIGVNGFVVEGQYRVDADDAADERDEGDELVFRAGAIDLFELFVGMPDAHWGQGGFVGFEALEQFADHPVGDRAMLKGLVVEDGERGDFIFVRFKICLELSYQLGCLAGAFGSPFTFCDLVEVDGVDNLFMHAADGVDELVQ